MKTSVAAYMRRAPLVGKLFREAFGTGVIDLQYLAYIITIYNY